MHVADQINILVFHNSITVVVVVEYNISRIDLIDFIEYESTISMYYLAVIHSSVGKATH
jgi:hypothetical protein